MPGRNSVLAESVSGTNSTAAEERLGVRGDAAVGKFEGFFKSLVTLSLALIGAKDFLRNKQVIFTAISIALAILFALRRRTTRSDHGTTFICFTFLTLGYLVVGITIDLLVPNFYNKWFIYSLFLATVTTIPDHQHVFQEMKGIFLSSSSKLRNFFIQLQVKVESLFTTNAGAPEEPSMNNNSASRLPGSDGGGVGEGNV